MGTEASKIKRTRELEPEELERLVSQARGGDARAFATLYNTYKPRIFALALHVTGRVADAEDVTHDAFLRAFHKLHSFEGRSQFFTWLYRIALNRALNLKRRRKTRQHATVNDERITLAASIDSGGEPAREVALRQSYTRLMDAFDSLSDALQATLILTSLQGLSHAEAGVVLSVSEGTISWRIHEARKRLRAALNTSDTNRSRKQVNQLERALIELGWGFAATH